MVSNFFYFIIASCIFNFAGFAHITYKDPDSERVDFHQKDNRWKDQSNETPQNEQPHESAEYEEATLAKSENLKSQSRKSKPNGELSLSAACIPENRSVDLVDPDWRVPNGQYYPRFILLEKCGGCCSEPKTCQNISSVPMNFTVSVHLPTKKAEGESKYAKSNTKVVTVYQHTKCQCDCKIKAEDCKAEKHRYSADKCRCECTNEEEASGCPENNQIWDLATCQCVDRPSVN